MMFQPAPFSKIFAVPIIGKSFYIGTIKMADCESGVENIRVFVFGKDGIPSNVVSCQA